MFVLRVFRWKEKRFRDIIMAVFKLKIKLSCEKGII